MEAIVFLVEPQPLNVCDVAIYSYAKILYHFLLLLLAIAIPAREQSRRILHGVKHSQTIILAT